MLIAVVILSILLILACIKIYQCNEIINAPKQGEDLMNMATQLHKSSDGFSLDLKKGQA